MASVRPGRQARWVLKDRRETEAREESRGFPEAAATLGLQVPQVREARQAQQEVKARRDFVAKQDRRVTKDLRDLPDRRARQAHGELQVSKAIHTVQRATSCSPPGLTGTLKATNDFVQTSGQRDKVKPMKKKWFVYVDTGECVEAPSLEAAIDRLQPFYPGEDLNERNVLPEEEVPTLH